MLSPLPYGAKKIIFIDRNSSKLCRRNDSIQCSAFVLEESLYYKLQTSQLQDQNYSKTYPNRRNEKSGSVKDSLFYLVPSVV